MNKLHGYYLWFKAMIGTILLISQLLFGMTLYHNGYPIWGRINATLSAFIIFILAWDYIKRNDKEAQG